MESFAGADLHKRVTQLAVLREGHRVPTPLPSRQTTTMNPWPRPRSLCLWEVFSNQARQDFSLNAVLDFGDDARLAAFLNARKPLAEVVLIPRRSRSSFDSCHKCVCFSLGFNCHGVTDPMIAETAVNGIRVLDAG
jgi:hypothetical protein